MLSRGQGLDLQSIFQWFSTGISVLSDRDEDLGKPANHIKIHENPQI